MSGEKELTNKSSYMQKESKMSKLNRQQRCDLWGMYTKDVLHRGLKDKISFTLYCEKIITYKSNQTT